MKTKKAGRPIDLGTINIADIQEWMKENSLIRKAIICQSFIALNNGASMTEVCRVLGVTREGVRLWKNKIMQKGLSGLLTTEKVGKRSKLTAEKRQVLNRILKQAPEKRGYGAQKWNGKLLQQLVHELWGYKICLRTAQMWLKITQ